MKHPARKWLFGVMVGSMLVGMTLLAQSDAAENFYAQKIMLENTIRHRISDAIFKITDNDRFVVDVKVFMDVQPGQSFQTEYVPEPPADGRRHSASKPTVTGPASRATTPVPDKSGSTTTTPSQQEPGQSVGTPSQATQPTSAETRLDEILPGIPGVQRPRSDLFNPAETPLPQPMAVDTPAAEPETMAATAEDSSTEISETTEPLPEETVVAEESIPYEETAPETTTPPRIRRHTVATTSVPRVSVDHVEITVILEDQVNPSVVENIRQVAMVASHFDRSRGDVMNIMTASFKDDKKQRTDAEQVLLKSIAERMALIEQQQKVKAEDEKAKTLVAEQEHLQKEREEMARIRQEEEERLKQREAELKKQREDEQQRIAQREEEMRRERQAEQERLAAERERLFAQQRQQAQAQLKADSLRIALLEGQLQELQVQLKSNDMEEERKLQLELEQRKKEQERSKLVQEQETLNKKLLQMQQETLEAPPAAASVDNTNLYLILGGAALLILLLGLVFAAMNRRPQAPVYPDYPPAGRWSSDDERIDKAAEKAALQAEKRLKDLLQTQRDLSSEPEPRTPEPEKMTEESLSSAATGIAPQATYRRQPVRTEDAARSDMDDVRKSVVSLAIGRPQSASRIISNWLDDSGGSATESATTSEAGSEENQD
ncbi:MAG: hypothetical protein K9N34_04715 [Candidatus Marinimicrobia bacterium]|nr:hypothetical protein [Candidatus Neomarinimicrobiota bacterium]MCF7839843.1 hypothetical protein [Candidatus Neomarinimicrobiota bacterium]